VRRYSGAARLAILDAIGEKDSSSGEGEDCC
jgi:hypothetical protein